MKTYTLIKRRNGRETKIEGTLPELIEYFSYTLKCGNSWNKKVNTNPKSVKTLIKSLDLSYDETEGIRKSFVDLG